MPAQPAKKPSILVVDDLPSTRELVGYILQMNGYTVAFAENGRLALAAAKEKRPDAVFVDVLMPGLDGYAVCAAIKKDPDLAHTKVLVFSALNGREDRQKAAEAGADGFLEKPVDPADLLAALKNALA